MTTTTSSPKRFRHYLGDILRKNRANMLYLFAIGFVLLPLRYLTAAFRDMEAGSISLYLPGNTGLYTVGSLVLTSFLWMLATLIFGFIGTSYMQNRRAVDLYHSLPLTRAELLMGNFLGSFLTVVLPMTVNYLLTMAASAVRCHIAPIRNAFSLSNSILEILGWLITVFSVQAVIFLVSTQVGSVFDTVIYSGVFLAAPPVLYLAHTICSGMYLIGCSAEPSFPLTACLSPALVMPMGKEILESGNPQPGLGEPYLLAIVIWLILGALLLFLACHAYKRRPSERAETTGIGGVVGTIFRILVIFLGSLFFGEVLAMSFSNTSEAPLGILLVSVLICGVLLALLVEAVMSRGFKGMKKSNLAVSGGVILLTGLYLIIMWMGGLGYENYVPKPEEVKSVTIDYGGRYNYVRNYELVYYKAANGYYNKDVSPTLTGEEAVTLLTELHESAIQDAKAARAQRLDESPADYEGQKRILLNISYTLKNGKTVDRAYSLALGDRNAEIICRLDDNEEFRRAVSPLERGLGEAGRIAEAKIGSVGSARVESIVKAEDLKALYEAVRQDAALEKAEEYYDPGRNTVCYIYFVTSTPRKEIGGLEGAAMTDSFAIPISDRYENTLAFLREKGIEVPFQPEWTIGIYDDYFHNFSRESGLTYIINWYGSADSVDMENWSWVLSKEDVEKLLPYAKTSYQPGCGLLYLCPSKDGVAQMGIPYYLPEDAFEKAGVQNPSWSWQEEKYDPETPAVSYENGDQAVSTEVNGITVLG